MDAQNNVVANYVWGSGHPLVKSQGNQNYYYLYNGHGDVVQMIDSNDGHIVNRYDYDIWGKVINQSEEVANDFKYAGEPLDAETGLYYLRARYYDPQIGRFINKDTYEGDIKYPLSLNLYTYVYNNPLKYIDPTGHWGQPNNDFKGPIVNSDDDQWIWDSANFLINEPWAPMSPGSMRIAGVQTGKKVWSAAKKLWVYIKNSDEKVTIKIEPKLYKNTMKEDLPRSFTNQKLRFVDGKYKNQQGYTAGGTYEFVISANGLVTIGKGGHIDLAYGQDVLYAGEISFSQKGSFKGWNNRSGHYLPDAADASKFVEILNNYGIKDLNMSNFAAASK
ncbi:RHS repeat-associated core domain-containing protein [Paenibacillus psychroresistens]|uniref:RHS repeat-associated core domain-containing protein n=1 Tax=Paenibacillus psychroresistens TaxID=1778678 RepID=A0A6B8RBZ0_9BACL|nr:RHS repeat-associated core domain-containing protein [Paenibacillus psychroresistens]QGQ93740.1 RHS repeat-associated core domain-containing protein [Paenibacillus psychroresistens]